MLGEGEATELGELWDVGERGFPSHSTKILIHSRLIRNAATRNSKSSIQISQPSLSSVWPQASGLTSLSVYLLEYRMKLTSGSYQDVVREKYIKTKRQHRRVAWSTVSGVRQDKAQLHCSPVLILGELLISLL